MTEEKSCMTYNITPSESEALLNYIESDQGIVVASGIVQLWKSQLPDHQEWAKFDTGVCCLVKDYSKKSYYFRLYDLLPMMLWEQEIYVPFSYNKINKDWYYFAGDDCNVAFSFSFSDEATIFNEKFMDKYESSISKKYQKRLSKLISTNARDSFAPSLITSDSVVEFKPPQKKPSIQITPIPELKSEDASETKNSPPINEVIPEFSKMTVADDDPAETKPYEVVMRTELPSTINLAAKNSKKNKLEDKLAIMKTRSRDTINKFTGDFMGSLNLPGQVGKKKMTIGSPEDFRVVSQVHCKNKKYEYVMTKDDETSKQIKDALAKLDIEPEPKPDLKVDAKKTIRKSVSASNMTTSVASLNPSTSATTYPTSAPPAPSAPPPPPPAPPLPPPAPPLPNLDTKVSVSSRRVSKAPRVPEKTQSVIKEESFDYLKTALEARMPYLADMSSSENDSDDDWR